jgi:hypothetical protein
MSAKSSSRQMSSRSTKNARELRQKLATFGRVTGTKKATILTLVTTQGAKANEFSVELVQNSVGGQPAILTCDPPSAPGREQPLKDECHFGLVVAVRRSLVPGVRL